MVKRHYGMSNERYKLIHYYYDIDEWELYDRKADPLELRNVINDPQYRSVKKQLHEELIKLINHFEDKEALETSTMPD